MSCRGRGRGRGHHEHHEQRGHHEHHEQRGHHEHREHRGHHEHHEHRGHHGHHGFHEHHEHRGHHGHHGQRDHSPDWKFGGFCQTTTTSFTIPPEVSNPVIQPTIPYVGQIAGIRPGSRLHVQGTVHPNAKEFQINFKTGINNGDDVVFHFNPRIGQYVYMNIFRSGKWQKEELGPEKPFVRGAPFQLLFLVHKDSYEVHVNGQSLYSFKHRLPLESVSALQIVGDAVIYWFGFEEWQQTTTTTFTIPPEISNPVIQPTIPYVGQIAGIRPGSRLHVLGTVHPNAKEFQINFKTGINNGDDVVFHFNPRIGQYVYMNIFRSGKWQKEELGPEKPFVRGAPFQLLFLVHKDSYEVHVNGQSLYSFKHRLPLESVSALQIVGDAVIYWFGFEDWKQTTTTFTIPPEISNPVIQPTIPYIGLIAGIRPGSRLHVLGSVHPNAKEFQINFKTGINNGDDVVFHFNPRIGQYVYMNIFRSGKWQKEELGPEKPFVRGAPFQLLFLVHKDSYEVHVNGQSLYSFKHRLPLESVSALQIVGDAVIYWFGFEKSMLKEKRTLLMGCGSWTFIPLEISDAVCSPALPYVGGISGGLKEDRVIVFQGTVPANAKGFEINFKTGPSAGDDTAFHYNPRIGSVTALNSFRNGSWETQEDASDKPFTKGGAFIILVVITSEGYEVFVNGLKHCTFKHRIPLEKVSTIQVAGDVSLLVWGFIDSWSTTSSFKELKTVTSTRSLISRFNFSPSEIAHPVINTALPYVGKIPGELRPDKALFLQGTIPADAKGFEINFKTGTSDSDDIAFHYNPRIGKITALNSFRNGSWGTQEDASDKPFTKGEAFQIFIPINSEGYEVYVNGLKHCMFKHRIPLEKVSALGIRGDISKLIWGFIDTWSTSSVFRELQKSPVTETLSTIWGSTSFQISHPTRNPALPCVSKIPGGIEKDMAVLVQGTLPQEAKSFTINFKTGTSDSDDIAFHYNLRIGSVTALNSLIKGSWGTQEDASDKPFTKGKPFQIFIPINSEGYEVYVNGLRHCVFKHRIPLEKVSALEIKGDLSQLVYGFIHGWSTSSVFTTLEKSPVTETLSTIWGSTPFQISHPTRNPALPCVSKIPRGIQKDMAVLIQGTLPQEAKSFTINFKTGTSDSDDIAFHYNLRIGSVTALNSLIKGSWGTQEDASDKPFTKGKPFQIFIPINSEGYEVYVNGLRHCGFKHRIPLEKVSALQFKGDLSQLVYGFIHGWSTSSVFTTLEKSPVTETLSTIWGSTPFQISHPTRNPALPCVSKIPGGIEKDMAVLVQGTLPQEAKSFTINFKTGTSDSDDIAFHYNLRIGSVTALNSLIKGSWGTQEDASDKPFTKGKPFQIFIPINSEGYEVYVNGLRHCVFKHRIPLEKVSALEIKGDLSQLVYGFIHGWSTSSVFTTLEKSPVTETLSTIWGSTPFQISHPTRNPALPCVSKIPGGIEKDMAVLVQGTLPQEAKSFTINFKTGTSDSDDIAFHYNLRIGSVTALNSLIKGSWGTQEDASDKPFTKGKPFQIFIPINSEGYEVYVNGLRHCGFKHRIPLEKVSALQFKGDLSQLVYGFIHGWSTSSVFTTLEKSPVTETLSTIWGSTPFQISHPTRNPALPCVSKIPKGIQKDMAVLVQGTLPQEAKSFEINFKTGTSDSDDIAFHYNPRIGEITALNSFRNKSWETQEDASDKPFTKGKPFQIFIPINSEGYEVYVNGLRHCGFKHRIPLEKVSALQLKGDLVQLVYGFIHGWSTSSVFTTLEKSPVTETLSTIWGSTPFQISHPTRNPALPCVSKIPGGIEKDMAVLVQGTLPQEAKHFTINFKTGTSDSDDIAFHYNLRIGSVTALNSLIKGSWGTQEDASDKPFTKGKPFQIFIPINSEGYEVYVNGLRHCGFKHRIPLEKVSALQFKGDLSQLVYGFIHAWSTSSVFTTLEKSPVTETLSTIWGSTPFQISHPTRNPALPCVSKIPKGIQKDMAVLVQGTLPQEAKSFTINFKTGTSDSDDIAFHYNLRIGSVTALNSLIKGSWGTQEDASDKPFTKGKPFQIFIPINSEGYEVYVNGLRHCGFKHRIPLEKVSALQFKGDLSQLVYGFIHGWSTSSVFTTLEKSPVTETLSTIWGSTPFQISHPTRNPALPCVSKIPKGIQKDMAVLVQGTLPQEAKSFTINFKTGTSDSDDIAFHYNLRIGSVTALNSLIKGSWGTQEDASDKPFTKGKPFQIFIPINSEGYEVYVNGLRHCVFKHRIPLEKVSALQFKGDLSQLVYGFIHGWSTSSVFTTLEKSPVTETLSTIWGSTPFQISHPTRNPALPCVSKIPGGIEKDMAVLIQGTLPQEAKSFEINFKTGTSDSDDIAFHYNPRIGSVTALNSFRNKSWETQEDASDKPFTKGKPFQIFIPINSEGYEVYVNGLRHCGFKHRIPLEKVSALQLKGDLSQLVYGFIHGWSTSSVFTTLEKSPVTETLSTIWGSTPFQISHPTRNPALPCVSKIPGGIEKDMAVLIQGTLPQEAKHFTINFKTGTSDSDDIAFHYNLRIGSVTALNSLIKGSWGTQEDASDKPFTKGKPFQIFIPINSEGYEVYVNGLRHCGFKHRIPLEKVSALQFKGDLSQLVYGFIHGWSTSSVFTTLEKSPVTETLSTIWGSTPFQISHPTRNPALPCVSKIPKGIQKDMAVLIQGTLPQEAKSFEINFKTGTSDSDDIAFHYNPRIGEITALNSFRNKSWETQEDASDKPFTKGKPFQIFIPINSEGYEVYVNGLRHCGFKHRIPLEKVSALQFKGDLSQLVYGFIHGWSTSSVFTTLEKSPVTETLSTIWGSTPFQISHPTRNPALPCVSKIPGGIEKDMAVLVQGTLPQEAKSFTINFKTGTSDSDDIAFHYNLRIGSVTALNSLIKGSWGSQEDASDKPFTKGKPFQIFIPINSEGYEVYVNGLRHCGFKHRIPLEKVSALQFKGDLSQLVYGFIHGWSTSSVFTTLEKSPVTETLSTIWGSTPFQISHPTRNPALPCVSKIPGGIEKDMAVLVQGTLPQEAKSFEINFKTGTSDSDDIAFHYNPRIGEITALNSFRNKSWETQEDASDKPFTKGKPFQIFIPINSEGYEVYVNGLRHCGFKHRIPLEKVSALQFKGDLSQLVYGFIHGWSTSSVFTTLEKSPVTETLSTIWGSTPFQISHPTRNPALPCVSKIPGGIEKDMAVLVQGTLPQEAKSFEMNFKTGTSDSDDIAFHYNPRIGEITALNSFRNKSWETQEDASDKPFTKGKPFQIFIPINSEGYEVYVNGLRHCGFKHRIPLEKVSALQFKGDLSQLVYGFIHGWSTSSVFTTLEKSPVTETLSTIWGSTPFQISHPTRNPALPCVSKIPGGIEKDMAVLVQGTLPQEAKSFTINFKTGTSDSDDIAFHYNLRIGSVTALNSLIKGSWGTQEDASDKPFTKGKPFQIFIPINSEGYEVYVNGLRHCGFKHRIPLEKVSALQFKGDLAQLVYGFIHGWSTSSVFTTLEKSPVTETLSTIWGSTPFQISHPTRNPALPCVSKIPGGIEKDMAVLIQGTLPQEAKSFEINFKTGTSDSDDIAFHYNPRIGEITALNSFRNKSWETQEDASDKPFTKGEAFQIFIPINSEGYEVYVNGLRHCGFTHRIPLEKVSALQFKGDLSQLVYGFIHGWSTSSVFTTLEKSPVTETLSTIWGSTPFQISHPTRNPALPCVSKIPGGIEKDMAVLVQGTLPQEAKSFELNFKTGTSDSDDIAFHYNPRIGDFTALNSFRNGSWETQENASDKPFTKGKPFQIFIPINSEGYEVYVNGLRHCGFKHRIPLEKVSALQLKGDLSQLVYGYIHGWSTSSFFTELQKVSVTEISSTTSTSTPFQISHPIQNPTLPYVGKIPEGINQDMAVFFQGTLPPDAKNFKINFKTGTSASDDIAFHYNPRIGNITALNSFQNGSWETQEDAPDKPFTKGEAFQIIIAINSEGYEVYVNGLKQCVFKHRIPLEKVSALEINGDLSLLICGFIHGWSTSSFFAELQKVSVTEISSTTSTSTPFQISNPIQNPTLPYVGKIPEGINQDMAVFFQGTLPPDAKNFKINFKTGTSASDDIAFHYNPRIGNITALNSFQNGSWETQEDAPDKPFTKGEAFQIIMAINSEGYEVYVNGLKQCVFKHRIPLEKVSALEINGDLSLLICGFIHGWSTSSFFAELQKVSVTEISSTTSTSTPFQISNPIQNPTLPYVGKIPEGINQDMAVFFQGTLPPDAKNFKINFKTGTSASDDIAFHYNPRIGNITALNSFQNGSWETQEDAPDKPFTKGEAFQIIMAINSEGYEVYVNGLKQCVFKHRIPLEKVSALEINGDLSLLICGFIHGWSTSSFFTELQKVSVTEISSTTSTSTPFQISHPIQNPTLPYVGKIPEGINQDMAVFFQGTLPPDAKNFKINFKTGTSASDDIAFHYNPRIGNITALNSFQNGSWETQEDAPDKPFTKGEAFQIIIAINSEGYEVYVNGLRHCGFKHRIPLEKVSALEINGDLSLFICGFIQNWSTSSFFTELQKTSVTEISSTTTESATFQISHPIMNPTLPYGGKIPVEVKHGTAVIFQGTVNPDGKRFTIEFSDGKDIAFHYQPQLGEQTVLNSCINGNWDKQINVTDQPFTAGEVFQVIVVMKSEGYQVYVNTSSHCKFEHRMPLEKVTTIGVDGDITIQLIGFIENWTIG